MTDDRAMDLHQFGAYTDYAAWAPLALALDGLHLTQRRACVTRILRDTYDRPDSTLAFLQSDLDRMALDNGNNVWREWPFTFALLVSEFSDSSHESRAAS